MDIAATSILATQQSLSQIQLTTSLIKKNAQAEQKTAAILAQAVDSAASAGSTRGRNLDISV